MKTNKVDIEGLDSFFLFVSKVVIVIPIAVVIISLFLKFNTPKKSIISSNNIYEGQSHLTPTVVVDNNSFKFDLKGPIICDSLFIKNKKVLLKNKLKNYLLNGDCLYIWEEGKTKGEKKCGLSHNINIAESYLGLLNINDLVNNDLIKEFVKNKNINLKEVIKNCKRENIKDSSIFEIPKKIIFKL